MLENSDPPFVKYVNFHVKVLLIVVTAEEHLLNNWCKY